MNKKIYTQKYFRKKKKTIGRSKAYIYYCNKNLIDSNTSIITFLLQFTYE